MTLAPNLIAELLLLGSCTGFLAGLLGVGGGMLLVPFLTLLLTLQGVGPALVVKMAVATSLATICFTSLSSVRAHQRRGAIRWDVVRQLIPGIVIGSVVGAQCAKLLSGRMLAVLFALFVGSSATQMLLGRQRAAPNGPAAALPGRIGMLGAGGVIGLLSALVGAGGAFVSVPFMTWRGVPIHNAIATSAAIGFPIALGGTAGYVVAGWTLQHVPAGSFGYLYLPALAVVSIASVLTAPLGARVSHALNVRQLKRAFALLLYALAAYMLARGLTR